MKHHHELYLRCDTFEKFRSNTLENYNLCLTHCFSVPSLSWDVVLNMTKVELELCSHAEMYK